MLTKFVANLVTKPGRAPVFDSPKDFGLNYEDVNFTTSDRVKISGWLIKGATDKVIIQSHFGVLCSRSGYTPKGKGLMTPYRKKVEFLKNVKHLVNAGYSVLMYDLRNHGNSNRGECEWITGGVDESKDVIAAVKFISSHEDYQDSPIGLISYCMGANATTFAYGAKGGLQEYSNIKALIAVQPNGNSDFLKAVGFPSKLIKKANDVNLQRGGKDFYRDLIAAAKNIAVPTLLVQGEKDPWFVKESIDGFYNALSVEKQIYWIESANKRFDAYDWFNHSPEKMLEFFNKYL